MNINVAVAVAALKGNILYLIPQYYSSFVTKLAKLRCSNMIRLFPPSESLKDNYIVAIQNRD